MVDIVGDLELIQDNMDKDETNGHISIEAWLMADKAIEELIEEQQENDL